MPLDYVASVSHDLKSPLNAILGFASLAREGMAGGADRERIIEDLEMVRILGQDMLFLINNMLTAARLQAGQEQLAPLAIAEPDLRAIIGGLEKTFQAEARSRKVSFSVKVGALPAVVHWDMTRIRYFAINNLISNALKFVGEGGRVEVGIDTDAAGSVVIRVADDGPGVPVGERQAIFGKFRQAGSHDRAHGGSGLGLYNAAQVTRAHRGSIEVRDGLDGKGVAFVVHLLAHPFADEDCTAVPVIGIAA